MRLFWIFILLPTLVLGAGPVYQHKEPEIQEEFRFVYQELGTKVGVANRTPASSSEGCSVGSVAWDTSYVYICTSTGTWKRSSLSAF